MPDTSTLRLPPDLTDQARHSDLFRDLDDATVAPLLPCLTRHSLPIGDHLFDQGEVGDSLYILLYGRLGVRLMLADGAVQELDELTPGTTVGEMALLTGQPRAATVYALVDSQLARLDRADFKQLAQERPSELRCFAEGILPRLRRPRLAVALRATFGPLTVAELHEVEQRLEWRRLRSGETLYREGESAEDMHLVVTGRLRSQVSAPEGQRPLGEIGPGEPVGEMGLLIGAPRSATVVATRDTDLVRLSRPVFDTLLETYPRAALQLAQTTLQRLARTNRTVAADSGRRPTPLALALVPIGSAAPAVKLAHRLAARLQGHGPTLVLDASGFDRAYGQEGAAQTSHEDVADISVASWLNDIEGQHDYVVYVAEPQATAWTRRCLRQADRLLLVARADDDPSLSEVETQLVMAPASPTTDLVLVHRDDSVQPRHTTAWLAKRAAMEHHHVRLGNDADMGRLARWLRGASVTLVLSGGGARGFAHIGVWRAIAELGLPVDRIGGTSAGALAAGTAARGLDYDAQVRLAQRFSSRREMEDYTLPLVSLYQSRKLTHVLREILGETAIEDAWLPFFCVSSSLTRGAAVVHRRGLLWEAVRASMAIPGVYSPILKDDEVLVDGGLMDHLPVGIARAASNGGYVVAVDLSPSTDLRGDYCFGPDLSGWQVLRGRLQWGQDQVRAPSIVQILLRVMEISSRPPVDGGSPGRAQADVLLEPPMGQFHGAEWSAYAAMIEVGYEYARPHLATWLAEHARDLG